MSLITEQRDGIVYLANLKVVEYGQIASEERLNGTEPTEAMSEGKKILDLLYALNNESQMTEKEVEGILYCLRTLVGEFDSFPSIIPPQGQRPIYLLQDPSGGAGAAPVGEQYVVLTLTGNLPNARRLQPSGIITLSDAGAGGDIVIGTNVAASRLIGRYAATAG